MKRKKGFISIISLVVILFMAFGGFNIGDIQRVFADGQSVGEGEVKITNVNVNKTDVTAMERVGITAQFEGGANVKPGTQVTIDLPQEQLH